MGIDPLASDNITNIGKSDCEGTFAAMRRDDEDAPKADLHDTASARSVAQDASEWLCLSRSSSFGDQGLTLRLTARGGREL